jgi:hypothetical protein
MESQMTTEEKEISPVLRKTRAERLSAIRKVWPWFFLILMVIVFSIISKTSNNVNFISYRSIQGILVYATQILLIGLAETIIIISGIGNTAVSKGTSNSKNGKGPGSLVNSTMATITPVGCRKNHFNGGRINKQAMIASNKRMKVLLQKKIVLLGVLCMGRLDPGGRGPPGSLA